MFCETQFDGIWFSAENCVRLGHRVSNENRETRFSRKFSLIFENFFSRFSNNFRENFRLHFCENFRENRVNILAKIDRHLNPLTSSFQQLTNLVEVMYLIKCNKRFHWSLLSKVICWPTESTEDTDGQWIQRIQTDSGYRETVDRYTVCYWCWTFSRKFILNFREKFIRKFRENYRENGPNFAKINYFRMRF